MTADRRAAEQIRLLERQGATCLAAPVIRSHPLGSRDHLSEATHAVIESRPDVVVLTTGIGVRAWFEAADAMDLGDQLRAVMENALVLARGPKATGAALVAGVEVHWSPPGSTAVELVEHLNDLKSPPCRVAIQLDGALGDDIT